ncbi:putative peptide zinc metalloprotease protein [Prosthecobacter fusiformis]|uniref:Putative peptide zinc metalloprotease protein n=1 Tax=Prosthecobacter fusiformis TaxID=48464 RepID=A0A4R7RJW4_9BACT|nr:HlyD family efflux transporter periplasmic adaptor subunit [Prosthecobacter fusiformis]TDU64329.1 putative peptide zinc metalloprotease protein [Prosthecobacter fusiformis]
MTAALSITEVTEEAASSTDDIVPSALRSDLAISHQLFEGRAFAIIKDPLSLKYFRLPAEDYALAGLFDGRRSVREIREAFSRSHPHTGLAQNEAALTQRIVAFATELLTAGFLEATAAGARRQLELQRLRYKPATPWGLFMKALFLKLPLWDPDALLIRMERHMRWIWSWGGFALSMIILLAGIAVFALNFPRISPSLNDFLTLPNLALVWVLTILVKIIHEFGHGLTCKHYGGEVHEMGAMLLVFSPFLYVDVTDSYLFPKRRHRILVAAAGIYIELIIAAIATLLWSVSQPGPTQQLLFNLMLITSVWTILFNANPLMKFDGYYMLTDILGVPNLRAKAQMCVSDLCRRLFFGGVTPPAVERLLPRKNRGWFVLYSIAAQLYLLEITLGIAMIFHYLLEPYGLSWLGDAIGAGAVVSMLIVPVSRFFSQQFSQSAATPGAWRRPLRAFGLLTVVVAGLMFCPWQIKVERPAVLRPLQADWVRAEVPGRLAEINVVAGQTVQAGDAVAVLSNLGLTSDVEKNRFLVERARRQVDLMLGSDAPAYYQQAKAMLAEQEVALAEAERLAARLTLRATESGVVLTPDLERLMAGSLRPGDALCEIAPLQPLQLYIPLNERQARHIRAGQKVELRVSARSSRTYEGQVMEDLKTAPATELPSNLIATLGGDIAAEPDADGKLKPLEVTYGILVSLPNEDISLRPGMTGTARIHGDTLPLWKVLWLNALDFVSLDYRL